MIRLLRLLIVLVASLALLPAATAEATITVGNTEDSGPGSLRQAINEAAPGETIVVPAGTYTLTSDELTIDGSVVISGAGPAGTIIRSGGPFRVFDIDSGATSVTISGVTIRDGKPGEPGGIAEGGGIRNEGSNLTLREVVVTNNTANVDGGPGEGGGIAEGGGIYSEGGALTLEGTVVSHNSATAVGASGEGGGIAEGGGISSFGGTSLTIRNSSISDNVADTTGGSGGGGGGISEGGGAYLEVESGAASISSSTVSGNVADATGGSGGGVGGIVEGGGLYLGSNLPSLTLSNMTIAGNTARAPGGGSENGGIVEGGGIQISLGPSESLTLLSSTIAANSAAGPGGIVEGGNINPDPGVRIANSIVSAGQGPPGSANCGEKLESLGFNLESANECGFAAVGDKVNTDPLLGPLQDNGGPAPTMAPAANSPAVDQGSAFGLTSDERGAPRPTDFASAPNSTAPGADSSDIGAVELQNPTPTVVPAVPPLVKHLNLFPPDFDTAIFVPPKTLYLRLKCPARFKPGCIGKAVAVTSRDHCTGRHGRPRCQHGQPMTTSVSAAQKANRWKVAKLIVKPKYRALVSKMANQPNKKLLIVRQLVHSKRFKHGAPQAVFHIYRVRTATSP